MSRSAALLSVLWVTGAGAATSVGLLAVHLVDIQVGPPTANPLTGTAVRNALTAAGPTPSAAPTASAARPHTLGKVQTVSTQGGILGARCGDGRPLLIYAEPTDGYTTIRSGPDEIDFATQGSKIAIDLSCDNEQLVVHTSERTTVPLNTPKRAPSPAATEPSDRQPTSPEPTDRLGDSPSARGAGS